MNTYKSNHAQEKLYFGHAPEDELRQTIPDLPVTYIEYALHKGKLPNYRCPLHQHTDYTELIYVDYGNVRITDVTHDVVLGAREGYIIPATTLHQTILDSEQTV